VVQVGGRALATATTAMGAAEPWTFRVSPSTIWDSDAAFVFETVIRLVLGVLAIEIAFRGVLFTSLRHVHGPIHSAVLTGMLFSAVHFASLPMMLALAWSGFAAALAVERTRSLLPAIACAAFSGLFETGLDGALYR
jgi:membrane protease YdiL (CAAX protease family)